MKLSRSVVRYGLIVAGLLVLFTVVGFFVVPPIAKSQLQQRLSAVLGRRVTVERVRVNPYALSVTLENFAIQEADGTTRFLGWKRLYVNFDALSSLRGEWVLSDVELDGFAARGVVNADRTLNVSDILARFTATPAPRKDEKPARPVRVGHLVVRDARVEFTDGSRRPQFATTAGPVSFDLTNFVTAGERGAPYRFEAETEAGEKFAWTGTIRAQPLASEGELRIENLVLPKYAPYYADQVRGEVAGGRLSVRGRYQLSLAGAQPQLSLRDGNVQLRGFVFREPASAAPAVELPAVDVNGIAATLAPQAVSVQSVAVAGGHLRVRREKDGALNLLTLLQPPAGSPVPTPATPSAAPVATAARPDVRVAAFSVQGVDVDIQDLAAPRPAELGVKGVQVNVKDVTLAEGARIPVTFACGWAPQGTVRVDGTVVLQPFAAELKVGLEDVALLPLSAYLEQFANVRLTGGAVSATLASELAQPAGKPPTATVSGDVTLKKLGLVDGVLNEDFAGVGQFELRGLRATTAPELTVDIDRIGIAGPYARVIVAPDQSVNLLTVAKPGSTPAKPEKPAATPAALTLTPAPAATPMPATNGATAGPALPVKLTIGQIAISDGEFRFSDRSLTPAVNVGIAQFGGTISGLSSARPAKGEVALQAVVEGAGPVAITGRLDPLSATPSVDLKVDVKNVDLVPLSPYSGKYAGYELARGKLVVDVKVDVDGRKLDAKNVVTLNQFTFGNAVQSPDATKLPVRLAVALLKDVDGKIVIDVPVQGSLDDPNFKVGRVVLRVIGNLLTKAAVSPFTLLGAAFGGGGDELAYQEFAPGAAELQPSEVKKLETMVKALSNRPGLSVDLEGCYDAAADVYALQRSKLDARIRRAVWQARHEKDPNIPPPEKFEVTPEDYAATVRTLFNQAFPPGTEFGAPLPPPPAVTAPPPPPPAGVFKRIVQTLTFANQRAQHKAADEEARAKAEHEKAVAAALAAGRPLDEMVGRLAATVKIDDADLQALAQARAERVRTYFTEVGKIAPDRLFLAKSTTASERRTKGPRVFLNLQ